MKHTMKTRIWAILLAACLLIGLIPMNHAVKAEAVSGVNSLTCASFISDSTRRSYIDTMMRYYINNNSKLATTLDDGDSVVFMFEGGSDNYDSYKYVDSCGSYRIQAVCIVVQKNSSGNAEIVFYNENCSSIPCDANWVTPGYETSGSTTILDGIYAMYNCNHNGNYAAFTTSCSTGWYTPYDGTTGYAGYCNGINIHTRSGSTCGGASYGWANSAGCQVIGYGTSNNGFNDFMKVTTGITWNSYGSYYNTFSSTGYFYGYYVVDRQLGLVNPSGTEYGSGSLAELYTTTDLKNITAFSTEARANADFGYLSECTPYPAHCEIEITTTADVNSLPCSTDSGNDSELIEYGQVGDKYTATKLFENSFGNLWYEVITSSGDTGYIYAGEAKYVQQITSDIALSSDATSPNGHVAGEVFVVNGTINSKYNELTKASVYVHDGFGTSGTKVTGDSASISGTSYTLDNSTIDYNTAFNDLETGKYTYAITAEYINYYATDAKTMKSNTGTINLMEDYFMVISSAADQNSCSHSYSTTTIKTGSCTEAGLVVKSCATCGKVVEESNGALGHSYGGWTTTNATCTTDGSKTRTCTNCGNVETEVISATGHSYTTKSVQGNCQQYAHVAHTCSKCGDTYNTFEDSLMSAWSTTKPSVDASLIESKTQYRYSDYETKTSYETSLSGYTQIGSKWDTTGTSGSVEYVDSWPSGFSTSNSLYSQYNKKSSKVTAGETDTLKTVINSDSTTGYLYYHWCYADSYYSQESSSGSYTTFHAYYDTTVPDSYTCDTSDMSYKTAHSTCSNSDWWFVTEVNTQKYTTYKKLFTYERWTDWSAWSDTAVEATDKRKVETQTLYRYVNAPLADHNWVNGTCSVCGAKDSGYVPENTDYYLFGYINGADYGCEGDYQNLGQYKFVNGKLTAKFDQTSYVAVKTGDNANWYMTNGYPGNYVTSATLYNTSVTGENSNKLYVPGGVTVTFTLVDNGNDTFTLSYEPATVETPEITLKYPTLSFEGEVFYNVYYTVSNATVDVEDMGLLTWYNRPANTASATYETAEEIIPGATYNAGADMYMVRSQGVPAKMLGDNMYLRIYAKLSDGTYAYSPVTYYNAKFYASDILANSTNADMKSLVVAMLNYGAAAQVHFNHNTGTLMNADLTAAQKALAKDFSNEMISTVVTPDTTKTANFKSNGGFSAGYPSVSFDGAFSINFYLTPKKAIENEMTLYCWDLNTYNSVSTLTEANATNKVTMAPAANPAEYFANYTGIAAKQIDETVFVAGVYTSGGVRYSSPVLCYSLSAYCSEQIANGSATMQDFAKATVVYGDAAKTYFAKLNG